MMKIQEIVWLAALVLAGVSPAQAAEPVKIIFDTDMESDVDDVGAAAVLHALADNGEAEILATMISSANRWSAPCLDAINTYYGRPNLPIGAVKGEAVPRSGEQPPDIHKGDAVHRGTVYAQAVAERFPHDLKSSEAAPDAAAVYRRVLAAQPNRSVVIVSVGYTTNLANLLDTRPDEHSPLNGRTLVERKVKRYVCMGGRFPRNTNTGVHGNWKPDPGALIRVLRSWPTPILFSGGGAFARRYMTGGSLPDLPRSHPVRRAYELFFERASWASGPTHHSADLLAVLVAVRGVDPYFDEVRTGYNHVFNDGTHEWRPEPDNEDQAYIIEKMAPERIVRQLDRLMVQPSAARSREAFGGRRP